MNNVVKNFKNGKKFKQNSPPGIRKMQTAAGGPITYEEDWSDKLEPWAAGVGLAGDAVGLGAAATGVGIPIGTAIAGYANIPNLFIDGYQTIRDAWRSYKDNGASLGSTAQNGGEFILDALGLKALQYVNKAAKAGVASEKYLTSTEKALDSKPWKRVGTGHGRVRARQSANHKRKYNAKRNKALEESNVELAKRGVRPAQGLYYQQKLTDEMAKRGYGVAVNDAIRSANRTVRQNLGAISGVSGGTNIYHLLPKRKSGGLIRKMQTASGGPLRIKFTPEQIAQFESRAIRVPGMNVNSNSTVGEAAKKAGEASVRQTNRKNAEKAEEFNKRNEMRSRVPVGERSGEVIYETKETGPKVIGMSGRDPLLGTLFDLYVGGKGLSALGKTATYYFKNNKALKGFNYNDLPREKYTYNDKTGDWNIDAPKKEWVKIGENDLVPDYFQSRAEYDRLIASGVSPEEAAEIMETRYLNVINARPGIFRNLGRWPYGESRVENGIIQPVYNSRKHVQGSLNDAKTTLNTVFHELGGHGSSMNVQYGVPLEGVSDDFALRLFKILEHNEKLRPKLRPFFQAVKDGNIQKAKELIPKDGSYLKGMNGEIDVKRIQDWIKYMEENQEYSARAIGSNMSNHYGMPNGFNEKQLREVFTDESVDNLLKNVWNYGVPVTTGGYTLYNLFNQPQQQLQYQKQGGKMNILELLKNGSGIHIKEKNKGKFTSYCGGKVTDECIQKGKNSSNLAIRKRATFAANARKWKHKEGGIIKAGDGLSTSLLGLLPGVGTYQDYKEFEKNPNWKTGLSLGVSALGDAAMLTGAGALIKGISAANKARKILGTAGKAANVARQQAWNQASKLKRESDAVSSLTLMNAPTSKILERQASKNLARKSYEEALKNDEAALKVYQTAANNPAFNFNSSQFAPLIYTNPGFHTVSQVIKHKNGGIIKAATGTQVNTDTTNNNNSKINWKSLLNTGVDYIGQMLPSILNSGGNSSSQQISDTSDTMTDTTLQYLLQQQQQAQAISDLDSILKSQYDPENPNANGGEAVRNHYKWLTLAPQQAQQKELQQQQKKLLDTQNKQKKARIINDALTTTLQTGLGLVSNYIGNKKGSSVS